MKKEEIYLWDVKRILFGDTPVEYMLEVLMRALIIYLVALVVLRLLGKRMTGQLSIIEMSVMITLGAIISVPMQLPDRGIFFGLLALLCTLAFQRGVNLLGFKSQKFEKLVQGELTILVKDGMLQLDEMEKTSISKQQLYSVLRSKKIFNLGKVKRMYLEGCGIFSVYEEKEEKPGLPLLPPSDKGILKATKNFEPDSKVVCINCGALQQKSGDDLKCNNCGNHQWEKAII